MQLHPEISDSIRDFIAAQHMFFVASAPLDPGGHVNLSPKGLAGSFDGPPNILRLYGTGRPVFAGDPDFDELRSAFPVVHNRLRAIIDVRVERVQDSCGYAVPYMAFEGHRDRLTANWADKDGVAAQRYWAKKNPESIDGLPAMPPAREPAGR